MRTVLNSGLKGGILRLCCPLVFCGVAATLPVCLASAQTLPRAPASSQSTRPGDPVFAAAEKAFLALDLPARQTIQKDLIWVAKFEASATGDFGPLTFAAIRRFEVAAKSAVDGILTPAERERLAKEAAMQRGLAKFTVETDKVSGMKIGIPGAVLVKSAPNASGGTRWQDKAERVTLDLSVYKPEDTLPALFAKGTDPKVKDRKVTYKLLRPEFFVITGETAGGKFYRRVQADPKEGLRGFSIGYDKAVASAIDPLVVAIASEFDPFPKAGGKPAPRPGLVADQAPKQRRASGFVLAADTVLAVEAAFASCGEIVLDNAGKRIPARLERKVSGTGLAVFSAKGVRVTAFRLGAPVNGPATLVQRDAEGILLASAASIEGAKVEASLQEGGAGAALFDRSGALIGLINSAPVSKFRVAGIVPTRRYAFLPAADLMKAAGLAAAVSASEGGTKSAAEIAEAARGGLVSLVCASDR